MRKGDEFDVETYLQYAGPVAELAREVITKLSPKPGEKILDVGCGDGTISRVLAEAGAEVHGIDVSSEMVKAAVRKGVHASVQSVEKLDYKDGEFDKIFSNSALHWVPNLKAGLSEMGRVLKDGGSIALEFGRRSPPKIARAVIEVARNNGYEVSNKDPWHRTDVRQLEGWLKRLGFEDIKIETKSKLQSFPSGMKDWLKNFVSNTFLSEIPNDKREVILDQITEKLKKFPNNFTLGKEAEWFGDYQRVTVTGTLNKEKAKALYGLINQSEKNMGIRR